MQYKISLAIAGGVVIDKTISADGLMEIIDIGHRETARNRLAPNEQRVFVGVTAGPDRETLWETVLTIEPVR